ncbi:hypothetical protein [Hydrogenophaga sp.]|jgi:hypothetical protein|uniref:hypothetical protein n=1 Tax=Hydrogenophaga sp. TaxID=1904254 RepID=UPI003F717FF8
MSETRPCALLCSSISGGNDVRQATPPSPPAPPEDESADPVGDGHSDAELAERKKPSSGNPVPKPA